MTQKSPVARVTIEHPIGGSPITFEAAEMDISYTAEEAEIEVPLDARRHFAPTGWRNLSIHLRYYVDPGGSKR